VKALTTTQTKGMEKTEVYNNIIKALTERSGYCPQRMIIYRIGTKENS
jgi:hypothetical protein